MSFGPAPTSFGVISITIQPRGNNILVGWNGEWLSKEPSIDIHLPGFVNKRAGPGSASIELTPGERQR